jgi:hypothetical protein
VDRFGGVSFTDASATGQYLSTLAGDPAWHSSRTDHSLNRYLGSRRPTAGSLAVAAVAERTQHVSRDFVCQQALACVQLCEDCPAAKCAIIGLQNLCGPGHGQDQIPSRSSHWTCDDVLALMLSRSLWPPSLPFRVACVRVILD